MRLKVIGSGSSGNCYILESDTEALVVEAGVNPKFVKKELDYKVSKISGVIATHRHRDHIRFLEDYRKMGFVVLNPDYIPEDKMLERSFKFGQFRVKAFKLTHDVPCYGYIIAHPDLGKMVYATDTEIIPYHFKNVNHLLVEANYSIDSLSEEYEAYGHVLRGHHSIEACCDFLSRHDEPSVQNVVLCHLSESNGDKELFWDMASKSFTNVNPKIFIAEKGLEIDV